VGYSQKDLYNETDARFWAQTGYKPGQKLDKKDPRDAAMMSVWNQIFAQVKKDNEAGILQLTYNSPIVQQHIGDAKAATEDTIRHLEQAAAASSTAQKEQHVQAATHAAAKSQQASAAAAAHQPATADPKVTADAASIIHTISGLGHDIARALGPLKGMISPIADAVAAVADPAPAQTAADYVAVQQAGQAPINTVAAHAGLPAVAGPPPEMTPTKPGFLDWVQNHPVIAAVAGAAALGSVVMLASGGSRTRTVYRRRRR
jgi:predicted flap endonuclease-1-like 5' DNA nuclease